MKSRFLICLLSASFILAGCSPKVVEPSSDAVTNAATQSFDFTHEISDLEPDHNVVYGKLANGLRYAVMRNATPSGTAALRVRFATGSLNETDEQRGLAHFLEHMAFNGTKNVPEGEMVKRLERFGLQFGADTNAHTSFDETVYKLNLPEVSEEILDEAFFIMRETAENMTLDPDAIDRERGIIRSEKRTRDSVNARALEDKLKFFTKGSRLTQRSPIGTDETLDNMQSELFADYYRKFYRPENTFVVLVGDIDTDLAIKKIEDTFSDWQAIGNAGQGADAGLATLGSERTGYFFDPEILTDITIASLRPYKKKPDTAAQRKANFIDGLGHRIFNQRLRILSKKPEADFLYAGSGSMGLYKTARGTSLTLGSSPENWQQALASGEQELRKVLQYGFTQAELDEYIAHSRTTYEAEVEAADTRKTISRFGGDLTTNILNSFGREQVFTHPKTSLEGFESYADSITTDEVWAAFKRQWPDTQTPHLYLKTSKVIENPQEVIRSTFQASRSVKVTRPVARDIGKFAYSEFGTPGKIVSDTYIKDVDAHLIKFENNVYLNFKQTSFAKDRVLVRVNVGDGTLSIPRKDEALRRLAHNVMANSGFEAHNADDISTLMAGKAVHIRLGVFNDTQAFGMGTMTVPSDIRDQLNLMTANIIAPGYRQEVMDKYFKNIAAWFPTRNATAKSVLSREVPRLIRSGDKRYGAPNIEKEFYAPTMQEVKDWIGPQLKDGMIDITIIGDIDKDAAVKAVAATLGTLKSRKTAHGNYPEMTALTFPKGNSEPVSFTHKGDANQAILRIYWPSPDGTDIVRTRRLDILRNIFQRRVIEVIREEEAMTYSPGVGRYGVRRFEGYGYIFVTMEIEPENIQAMTAKIHEIAVDFQKMNISQDEFDRAIKPVIEKLDSSLENNSYWMGVLSNAQTDSWGIDNFRTREQVYKDMKLADIKPYAGEIFRKEKAFHVQITPAKQASPNQ